MTRILLIVAALSALGWSILAAADDRHAGAPLTLAAAMHATLENNPALKTFRVRREELLAEHKTAGLRPPLKLRVGIENVAGTGTLEGTEQAELTLALSHVVELGGQQTARVSVAGSRQDLLETEQQSVQLDLLATVARRFVHVRADQERLALATEATALSRRTLESVERRVRAGQSPQAERARARAALAQAELDAEHAAHELGAARVRLASLWGESRPNFNRATGDLLAVGEPGDMDRLMATIEANPDIARFDRRRRMRNAELRLAEAQSRGGVEFSGGLRRLEGTEDTALVFGASLPLFSASRSQGEIMAADARYRLTEHDRQAAILEIRSGLYSIYQERIHALTAVEVLHGEIIPQLTAALNDTRRAYESGRYGYQEFAAAQRELLNARRSLIDAAETAHINRIELERLAGMPLEPTLFSAREEPSS
ncbi:MAG: TolC family protein [Pseudomonadota bacterium]|nr:TolC family protein [Pseudomonadota bacterium]